MRLAEYQAMKPEKSSMAAPRSPYEIVERAEKLLGTKQIAERLRVSEEVVRGWCKGSGNLSDTHLLRLADLLARYAESKK
jgi:DNA-binding transcriptional regulator YiaG